MSVWNVSRRGFLQGLAVAGGALVLGVPMGSEGHAFASEVDFVPGLFLAIQPDGVVKIIAHRSEMGTGIRTSLPMVLADELEASWERVEVVQAIGDERYGSQDTDGSRSIRRFYAQMRTLGATARTMLESAAAATWGVDPSLCTAELHSVTGPNKGQVLGFGELVAAARELEPPDPATVKLKDPEKWRYIGKGVPITDNRDIVRGAASFGIDVRRPGMRYAAVARSPVLRGTVKSYDKEAALAVPGVLHVIELPPFEGPPGFQALGGVAVVATNTWAAFRGRDALAAQWDPGPNASYDSKAYEAALLQTVNEPGASVRNQGDVEAAFAAATRVVGADYFVPHLAHAPMEPPVAVAEVSESGCEVWAPTQNPQAAQAAVGQALGMEPGQVVVHVTLLGGGFGRKSKPDFIVEAALLSRELGIPIKVQWTREDDLRHDYYHSVAAVHVEAALDGDDKVTAWRQRSAFPSIMSTFDPSADQGSPLELGLGFLELPFDVANVRCEVGKASPHVRIGWLRSVAHIYHAFAEASFVDELAASLSRDPVEVFLELLGPARHVDLGETEYHNQREPLDRYPIDTGRLANVTRLVAEKAGWGKDLPEREALGFAAHRSFLSYVATVVHVRVSASGEVRIPRVDVAVDCGTVVNPDRVLSQIEGGSVFGASLALMGQITAKGGAIEQSNFHDYPVTRIDDAPRHVHVHLVQSDALPAGIGEVAVPPFAPALCNAIYAATGKRIRELPVSRHDLSV